MDTLWDKSRQDLIEYLCLDEEVVTDADETQMNYLFQACEESSSSSSSSSSDKKKKKKAWLVQVGCGYYVVMSLLYPKSAFLVNLVFG